MLTKGVQVIGRQLPTYLSLLAAALLVLTPQRTAGLILAAGALAAVVGKSVRISFPATTVPQLMLAFGIIASFGNTATVSLGAAGALLILLIVIGPAIDTQLKRPTLRARNLPGYHEATTIDPRVLFAVNIAALGLLALLSAGRFSAWPVAVLATVNLVACAAAVARSVQSARAGGHHLHAFASAMEQYSPAFALYFSAPPNTEYHVHMWLPYLRRIGRPFVIIVREPGALRLLAATTDVPVIFCPSVPFVDRVVTPGMRACFYVNNGAKNSHMVRFNEMTHIQLLHGDSDKASSFNPVTGMFDRIFVAGQAAIDRYAANGVHIPAQKFDIIGRPQVEAVEVTRDRIRDIAAPVVLYASTWVGLYTDANYSSLPIGEKIIRGLLERGATVILRPHPYAARDAGSARIIAKLQEILAADREKTGRAHVFGPAAQTDMSVFDCVNRADAMISDVSGVASDFLYSGKPFALTNMLGDSADDFEASFPLARAAYVIEQRAGNLDAVLGDLLNADPLEAVRRDVRTYYLGDFDEAGYADAFVRTARGYVDDASFNMPLASVGSHDRVAASTA